MMRVMSWAILNVSAEVSQTASEYYASSTRPSRNLCADLHSLHPEILEFRSGCVPAHAQRLLRRRRQTDHPTLSASLSAKDAFQPASEMRFPMQKCISQRTLRDKTQFTVRDRLQNEKRQRVCSEIISKYSKRTCCENGLLYQTFYFNGMR